MTFRATGRWMAALILMAATWRASAQELRWEPLFPEWGAWFSQMMILPPDTYIAVTEGADGSAVIRRSDDRGATWTDKEIRLSREDGSPMDIKDVAVAHSDTNVVYAVTGGYSLYRSDDGGDTWRNVYPEFTLAELDAMFGALNIPGNTRVIVSPDDPNVAWTHSNHRGLQWLESVEEGERPTKVAGVPNNANGHAVHPVTGHAFIRGGNGAGHQGIFEVIFGASAVEARLHVADASVAVGFDSSEPPQALYADADWGSDVRLREPGVFPGQLLHTLPRLSSLWTLARDNRTQTHYIVYSPPDPARRPIFDIPWHVLRRQGDDGEWETVGEIQSDLMFFVAGDPSVYAQERFNIYRAVDADPMAVSAKDKLTITWGELKR